MRGENRAGIHLKLDLGPGEWYNRAYSLIILNELFSIFWRKDMGTTPITDGNFETEVLKSDKPVLVDFWAEWCGPCRALGPKLEEISDEIGESVKIVKLNIDENPDAPKKYGVRGIPTMILFKSGNEVEQIVGNQPKENIKALLEKHTS